MRKARIFHPIVKWVFTLFLLVFIPTYWTFYGSENFLWISDVALFFLYLAIVFESKMLASMAIVGDLFYATVWSLDFLYTLLAPSPGLTRYMLNPDLPIGVRVLSLFHIALPPLMFWVVRRLGYAPRAWRCQIAVSTALLFLAWFVSSPEQNINFAFGYHYFGWEPMPYLVLFSIANGVLIWLTHIALRSLIKKMRI